jgi:iron complex outermembrane receptor protein
VTDRAIRINLGTMPGPGLPIVLAAVGNPEFRSEQLVQTEAGYRVRIGSAATIEATAFRGTYEGLTTNEPLAPVVELTPAPMHLLAGASFANLLNARTSGVEVNARWTPVDAWQLGASYSFLRLRAHADPASRDATAGETDGNAPEHQWQVRSTVSLRPGVRVSASAARVGPLKRIDVPAHTRLDARAEFRLNRHFTAAVTTQNLLSSRHQEFSSDPVVLSSSLPRSARLEFRWSF